MNLARAFTNVSRGETCPGAAGCLTSTRAGVPAVDLFCGMGGVTAGMLRAGLDVRLAVDFSAPATRTHRAWHPGVPVRRGDVSQVRPRELAGRFVWASPSCKPWSSANTSAQRGESHPEYYPLSLLVGQAIGSRVLVIENVPGLLWSREGRGEFRRLEAECARLGVSLQVLDVNATEFGLHQSRRRMFLVIGAPLILWDGSRRSLATHATVTTKGSESLEKIADLQRVTNPTRLEIPDWRSGRRRKGATANVSPHVARRLIGNAIPPEMAEAVCRAVLEAVRPGVGVSVSQGAPALPDSRGMSQSALVASGAEFYGGLV